MKTLTLEEKLFNADVMTLDTYIMFKLKEITENLKPELIKKEPCPNFTFNGRTNSKAAGSSS